MLKIDCSPASSRRRTCASALALLFLGVTGCGNHPVPVNGTVTLDGQPLTEAMVFFYPITDGKEGRMAAGLTDPNGKFELGTMGVNDGAYRRQYKVVIQKYVPNKAAAPKAPKNVPANDIDAATAKQDAAYWASQARGFLPYKNTLPDKYADQNTTPLTCNVEGRMTVDFPLTSK